MCMSIRLQLLDLAMQRVKDKKGRAEQSRAEQAGAIPGISKLCSGTCHTQRYKVQCIRIIQTLHEIISRVFLAGADASGGWNRQQVKHPPYRGLGKPDRRDRGKRAGKGRQIS